MIEVFVKVLDPRARPARDHLVSVECSAETSISQLKSLAVEAARTRGATGVDAGRCLVRFMDDECLDASTLADFGVTAPWIRQVAGFVLEPRSSEEEKGGE